MRSSHNLCIRLTLRLTPMYAGFMKGEHPQGWWEHEGFSPLDRLLTSVHRFFILEHPVLSIHTALGSYVAVMLLAGSSLGISSNYFVLIPVFAIALVFGLPGGLLAGLVALPANLALFHVLGHPEFSPDSKAIAEVSGVFVGSSFGYLADYFKKLSRELQRNRSADPSFREAAGLLLNRVYAVSLAHDTLFGGEQPSPEGWNESVDCETYLRSVAENTAVVYPEIRIVISMSVDPQGARLDKSVAQSLGIIVNELAVNAAKHAYSGISSPCLDISLNSGPSEWSLTVSDNGTGLSAAAQNGLGWTLIESIAARLDGRTQWRSEGGLQFRLAFPNAAVGRE